LKIWILNAVALKPNESGITRHYDLAQGMKKKGHDIRIFASSFLVYHFKWRDPSRKNYAENVNGVWFEWLWNLPYKGNGVKRVFNMISYFIMVLFRGLFSKEKPDVVVGSSVHLFACLAGYFLARWKKAAYIVELRDLWPRTLIDFGAMSEKHPAAIMFGAIEKFVYKKADRIIVTLPGAVDYIESFGVKRENIYVIANGIDLERRYEIDYGTPITAELEKIRKKHKKIAMYVGAHGMANALHTVVDTAKEMDPEQVGFVFVGDGPEKEILQKASEGYDHIYFFEPVAKKEVMATLNEADVLIVSMLNTKLYRFGISLNKLNDYLLSGKPILFAGNVYNNIVEMANAGVTVEPENIEAMKNGLNNLLSLTVEEREEIKESSFKYVSAHHDIEKLAGKFIEACQINKEEGNKHESTYA
jgi:glycosyltransferase involved in cell wall biosynthesis